ncbi:hypothetical protein ACPYPG_34030 [Streptomyces sp. FR-108]|uniref:hypothetical protein n=1 Tax=Streptomyces sp. FR-108 TaxID=3416665 RepID=UPI003CE8BE66
MLAADQAVDQRRAFDDLLRILLAQLNATKEIDWPRAVIDGSQIDTKKRGARDLSSPPISSPHVSGVEDHARDVEEAADVTESVQHRLVWPAHDGTQDTPDETLLAVIIYVLVGGRAWRYLVEAFGVSPATAHRRFTAERRAGLRRRLDRAVLDELGVRDELDWASAIVDSTSVRAIKRGGTLTGPNPVDAVARSMNPVPRCGEDLPPPGTPI